MKLYNLGGWLLLFATLLGLYSLRWQPTPVVDLPAVHATAADTVTYADDRIVYKLPTDTARNSNGDLRRLPDLSSAPIGARFRVIWKPSNFDSVMVVTGDTFALSPMDSATATALADSWDVIDPHEVTLAWHDIIDPVTGLAVQMASSTSDTLEVGWNETADDYQIVSELEPSGEQATDTVSQTNAYERILTTEGVYQACVRTLRSGNLSDANCGSATYDATPDTLLAGGDLGSTYGMTIRDSTNVATILGFPYQGFPADSTEFPILGNEAGEAWWNFEKWSNYVYADSSETMVYGGLTFQEADSSSHVGGLIGHTFYDRFGFHYAYWWKTGEQKWKTRADSMYEAIRSKYWAPNNYNIGPRRHFPEGSWVYYFTRRSNADSAAVADTALNASREMADNTVSIWLDDFGDTSNPYTDGRVQGRVAQEVIYMALFDSTNYGGKNWQTLGPEMADSLMSYHELTASSIGVYRPTWGTGHPRWGQTNAPSCGGHHPFMANHAVNYTMQIAVDLELDTTTAMRDSLVATIKGSQDTIMDWYGPHASQPGKGVSYVVDPLISPCDESSTAELPALNVFHANSAAWYFRETGDSTYWHWAYDSLIVQDLGVYGDWCGGSESCGGVPSNWHYNFGKEYNESFMQFFKTIIWLHDGP